MGRVGVVCAAEAEAMDREAEARGVAPEWLMEVAGAKAAHAIEASMGPGPVTVVVGSGKNGGDGLVVARFLARERPVAVVLVRGVPHFDGAERLVEAAGKTGARIVGGEELSGALADAAVVVDALLGTGVRPPLRDWAKAAIEAINRAERPVASLDLPSGVTSDTGQAPDGAVRAVLTIAFGAAKWGHFAFPGADLRGKLAVADIGLRLPRDAARIGDGPMLHHLLKPLQADGHKYRRGRVGVVGGSPDMPGAPQLAAAAAQRTGVGLVELVVPRSILNRVAPSPAILVRAAGADAAGRLWLGADDLALLRQMDAIVVGPGLGRGVATDVMRALLNLECPLVIDADGLALAATVRWDARSAPVVMTPHEGEMAGLMDSSAAEVRDDRIGAVRRARERFGAGILLKGPYTIAQTSAGTVVNPTGVPELATAGSGDVLAGLIGGLLAQGYDALEAMAIGAYVHGTAARRGARRHRQSLIATDLVESLAGGLDRLLAPVSAVLSC